ncbi:hypothetical protein SEPCBS119000_003050 [Sporothrix epigloea]|uniref:Ferric oxidoreductase domain-containing protein n=1 Tax=Sporothrix epigloea TaxID=1892477 RepID=A0ABP0DNQ0_9PEZI
MGAIQLLKKQLTAQRFIFLILFWGLHFGLFALGWYKQASDPRLAELNTLTYSVWISRGAGLVLSFDGMFILLPVCRTLVRIVRPKLRFLPLDENIWLHRQLAYAMLLFAVLHTAGHYVK